MKTISLKKVAAVAVASLGFGLLSVAPAQAAASAYNLSAASSTIYGAVSTALSTTIRVSAVGGTPTAGAVLTSTLTITSKPSPDGSFAIDGDATPSANVVTFATAASGDAKYVNAAGGTAGTNVTTTVQATPTALVDNTTVGTLTATIGGIPGKYVFAVTPTIATQDTSATMGAVTVTVFAFPTSAQATAAAIAGANSQIVSVLGDGGTPASTLTVTGVAGAANTVQVAAIGSATLPRIVTVTGAGTYFTAAGTGVTLGSGTNPSTATVTATSNYGTLTVATPTVGTATVSIASESAAGSGIYSAAAETVTITINAAATSGAVSTSTSSAFMNKNPTINAATTEATAPLTTPATSSAALVPSVSIKVTLGQSNGAITSTTKVTASITGPGLLKIAASDTDPDDTELATGRSITSTVASTGEVFTVGVIPDGVAGVSTITITAGTYTVTKTVTFVGTVASLTFNKVLGSMVDTADGVATGDTDAYAGFISGKDAAGNAVTLTAAEFTAVTAAQNTAAVITAAAVVAGTAATYSGVAVAANAPTVVIDPTATKTGAKTLTLTHTATGLTVVASFTVGLAQATKVTLSLDKASYTPGEKMTLTLTALDAGGFAIADSAVANFLVSVIASSAITGDALAVTTPTIINGKSTFALFAPLAAGPISFSTTTGAAANAPTVAVTATASAIVTDLNAAASAALNTRIDSLNAKIVALTALIAKIMKSLKIK